MKFQEGVCNTNIPVNKTLLNMKGKMLVFLGKRKKGLRAVCMCYSLTHMVSCQQL